MTMLESEVIICFSTSDWDFPWGSRQELMRRFALQNKVIFVEYQASLLHPFRFARYFKRLLPRKKLQPLDKNLYRYTPSLNIPFGSYLGFINILNQRLLRFAILRLMRKMHLSNPVLWIYTPLSAPIIGSLREKLTVYHCIDNFIDEKAHPWRKRTIESLEMQLLKRADLIFVASRTLYWRIKSQRPDATLFPSAVNDEFLVRAAYSAGLPPPKELEDVKKPRIGMAGILNEKLDIELLGAVIKARPEWSFIFIGPVTFKKVLSLKKFRNTFFLGSKRREDLPQFLQAFDVCLIPYRVNMFTKCVSPLKLFEYFSVGKPVVSTGLPDVAQYVPLVNTAEDVETFIRLIEEGLNKDDEQLREQRILCAKENTWGKRFETVCGAIYGKHKHT